MYLYCVKIYAIPPPMIIVQIHPPMNPSTVFFGERRMSGVRPQSIPQMYAKMSFVITRQTGRKNQMRPSKMELMIKCAWKTTRRRVICVQQNWVNWYAYAPGVNVMTKNTKPTKVRFAVEGATEEIEDRRDETVVNRKVEKVFIHKDNMLEIVNQTLSIQKEHCRSQKVPCH
jgi:hypothetical protein